MATSKVRAFIRMILRRTINQPLFYLLRYFYIPRNPKKQKWRFFGYFRVRPSDGNAFRLYNNAFRLETEIFWRGIDKVQWENETRRIWKRLCPGAQVILDIGANTGVFSMLASSYNPAASIYSFEPQPNVYEVLEKNNVANGSRCVCEQLALADKTGILPFYNTGDAAFTSRNTTHGSLNREWRQDDQVAIEVNVDRLDSYLQQHEVNRVDLMKIDVETFEPEVLRGYGSLLHLHKPVIIMEVQNTDVGRRVMDIVDAKTYRFFRIIESGGITETSNLDSDGENLNFLLVPRNRSDVFSSLEGIESKELI